MTASLKSKVPSSGAKQKAARASPNKACRHCGIPVLREKEDFCCAGCAYVYRLIHDAGFDAYYQIKDKVTAPADASLSPGREYSWLEDAQHDAETSLAKPTPELCLDVQGISCAGCVWLIERVFKRQPGAGRIEINAQTGQMRMLWEKGVFSAVAFAQALKDFNYIVSEASVERATPAESKAIAKKIGLCAAFAMNVMLFTLPVYFGMEPTFAYARLFGTLSMGIATLSLLAGGGYFIGKAACALREGAINIDLPIALGIVVAYSGSFFGWLSHNENFTYFDFVATFILLMLIGRWAQLVTVERNQRRLLAQQPVAPRLRAWASDGKCVDLPPEQLVVGQRFLVAAGQILPVEARLLTNEVTMDLSWINGESEPRSFRAGQSVPSGAMNLNLRDTEWVALQVWSDSLLSELTRPMQRVLYRDLFLERVISGYLLAILGIAFLSGLGWLLATGDGLRSGSVVTAVLVVSCPCAIGLAFPLADEIATVALRKRGVFVRALDLWPRLVRVRQIIFDKTGTLTLETPALVDESALAALAPEARSILLAMVRDSPHPVARCLSECLLATRGDSAVEQTVIEHIGLGLSAVFNGVEWRLGRPAWVGEEHNGSCVNAKPSDEVGAAFGCDGVILAGFQFEEALREGVAVVLEGLRQRKLRLHVLSGDLSAKVDRLTKALGLPVKAGVGQMSPRDKGNWLRDNSRDDAMMLGDGANDSFAFDQALCRGTPVIHRGILAEKADFYYLGPSIAGIKILLETNDVRRRTHRVLLVFSVAYNLAAVGLAVAGRMNPLLAAILMPASSLATLGIVAFGMRSVWK